MSEASAPHNPFPGPQPYRAVDRGYFFGREGVTRKLAHRLMAHPCTTVFGPSGAGKSSLMQAGVIPLLEEAHDFRVVSVDGWPPGEAALSALAAGGLPGALPGSGEGAARAARARPPAGAAFGGRDGPVGVPGGGGGAAAPALDRGAGARADAGGEDARIAGLGGRGGAGRVRADRLPGAVGRAGGGARQRGRGCGGGGDPAPVPGGDGGGAGRVAGGSAAPARGAPRRP
ncbi:nSTAND1 domain-containing NTPase [Sorangium sp. So ce1151]|uniref:nSTAND1 domain-containing NTPase n=1 Tax=Sorangium sp. So ce1151 TaxID=3133332 RepID=UPI003F5F069A